MARPSPKPNAAIDSLKEKMSRDPFSRAFLQLAEEYRKAGRFEEAVTVCLEGLARHPSYHTARISLGRTYLEAGNLDAARRSLAEVLEMAPENHLAGRLLAEVQRKIGDTEGAAETYRTILRHYPADKEVEALLRDLTKPAAPPVAPPAVPTGPFPAPVAQGAVPAPAATKRPGPPAAAPGPAIAIPAPPGKVAGSSPVVSEPSFDYRSEDLGLPSSPPGSGTAAAGTTPASPRAVPTLPRAAAPPPPPDGREPGQATGGAGDALQTNTLAELYLRQGLVDRAIEVYRSMLRVDPSNDRARRRLDELGGGSVGEDGGNGRTAGPEAERPASPSFEVPVTFGAGDRAADRGRRAAAEGTSPPRHGTGEQLQRLRRFLQAMQSGRPDGAAPR